MSEKLNSAIAVIGIDIGKNSFHVVGHDRRGAIVLRQKWSHHCRLILSQTSAGKLN
jgi:transposase